MQKNYFNFNALEGEYSAFETEIRRGTPTAAFGVSDSLKYLLSSLLPFPVLYVTADGISAQKAAENARSLSGKDTAVLAAKDEVLFYRKALSKDSLYKRLNGIHALQNGCQFVAAEIDALSKSGEKEIIICGDGTNLFYKFVADNLLVKKAPEICRFQNASGVGLAAAEDFKSGNTVGAEELLPIYLRLPQAERELKSKNIQEEKL
jgi:tRNA threonylcarbamoyladenosine biosynthesis protein TsaB